MRNSLICYQFRIAQLTRTDSGMQLLPLISPLLQRLCSSSPLSLSLQPPTWIKERKSLVEMLWLLRRPLKSLLPLEGLLMFKWSHPNPVFTSQGSEIKGQEKAAKTSYIPHQTSDKASGQHQLRQQQLVPANQNGKPKTNKSRHYKKKPQKPERDQFYKELPISMQSMITWMDNQLKAYQQPPLVRQVWVRKDEAIHPLRGSELTQMVRLHKPRFWSLILEQIRFDSLHWFLPDIFFCLAVQEPYLFYPHIFSCCLEKLLQVLFGDDRKSTSSGCFSIWVILNLSP